MYCYFDLRSQSPCRRVTEDTLAVIGASCVNNACIQICLPQQITWLWRQVYPDLAHARGRVL